MSVEAIASKIIDCLEGPAAAVIPDQQDRDQQLAEIVPLPGVQPEPGAMHDPNLFPGLQKYHQVHMELFAEALATLRANGFRQTRDLEVFVMGLVAHDSRHDAG